MDLLTYLLFVEWDVKPHYLNLSTFFIFICLGGSKLLHWTYANFQHGLGLTAGCAE